MRYIPWLAALRPVSYTHLDVYKRQELGGAIMQTAWYIAVPFNILVTVPLGLGFYELDNQFVKKLREVKHLSLIHI